MFEVAIGYHGTTQDKAEEILARQKFDISTNDYDWLGRGTYFWQSAPVRAWAWALAKAKRNGFDPAVLSVEIQIRDCLDLLDITYWKFLKTIAPSCTSSGVSQVGFIEAITNPTVTGKKFNFADRLLIDQAVASLQKQTGTRITSVRAAFPEDNPIHTTSWLFERSHVQIAVRDPSVLTGTIQQVDSIALADRYRLCQ